MKKIYFILSLAVVALLSACSEDFNEHNFPGYKDAADAKNVASYAFTFANADYASIGDSFTKIYQDSVSALKAQLKVAKKNNLDTTVIFANITRINGKLKTDSTLVAATAIKANNQFIDSKQAIKFAAKTLNSKYIYADLGSETITTYNLYIPCDTTTISNGNKYVLATADYDAMGTSKDTPGQYDNFSSSIDPTFYLPIWMKTKYPYAVKGDAKIIRYKFYIAKTSTAPAVTNTISDVFVYDGTSWAKYNSSIATTGKFIFNGKEWLFDPSIYITMKKGLNATDDYMLVVNYIKENQGVATPSLLGYYKAALEYEYYYGFDGYNGSISWKEESTRLNDPDYAKLTTIADKVAYMTQRTQEGLAIYLGLKYPDAKPKSNDVDQYCYITTIIYGEFTSDNYNTITTAASFSKTTYKYKYQRIDNGNLKWKYISREKL